MARGWMTREQSKPRRPKTWLCICMMVLWAVSVGLIYWAALVPGPILAGLGLFFRFAEVPR
jgi:hypothetical protein